MPQPLASIIIVTFNSSKTIEKCIRSFYEHHSGASFEVIVIDNHSQDNTIAIVEALGFANLRVIRSEMNLGFGAANNKANADAKGEYLYLVNPDTYFIEPVLKPYLDFMAQYPNAAACSGTLYEEDLKTVSTTIGSFPGVHSVVEDLGFHLLRRRLNHRKLATARTPFAVDFISGASVFIRRSLFNSVGGFDKIFFLYFEETDLFLRIAKEKTLRPWVLPSVKLVHIGGFSTGKKGFNPLLHKIFQESRYEFFKKHYSATLARAVMGTDRIRQRLKSALNR